jgi:hypothetical protein
MYEAHYGSSVTVRAREGERTEAKETNNVRRGATAMYRTASRIKEARNRERLQTLDILHDTRKLNGKRLRAHVNTRAVRHRISS